MISDLAGNQYYESSALAGSGVFVSFKDNTTNNYDVYGQHILFAGNLDFVSSGVAIASGTGDQQSSSVAYDPDKDEALVCYESPDGSETDINCNEVNLSTQVIDNEFIISANDYNQNNPYVYWSGHSFLISWEDSRMTSSSSPEQDIYFQEVKNGAVLISSGGVSPSSVSYTHLTLPTTPYV